MTARRHMNGRGPGPLRPGGLAFLPGVLLSVSLAAGLLAGGGAGPAAGHDRAMPAGADALTAHGAIASLRLGLVQRGIGPIHDGFHRLVA